MRARLGDRLRYVFRHRPIHAELARESAELAERAGVTFAQFVMLTPFPGTVDFERWERDPAREGQQVAGVQITRHWLIPQENRPKVYVPHPTMSAE